MKGVFSILLRLAIIGFGLILYTEVAVPQMNKTGDVAIGAGLIAFGALALVGFAGGLLDGMGQGALTSALWWLAIAAGVALGWWMIPPWLRNTTDYDYATLLEQSRDVVPFIFGLVAGPAVLASCIGGVMRRGV
ncbi:hypothetical protein EUA93_14045 [Nocardioides oleivorans]|uniref:Uncharacterized protein n=1 Tax=Nocardioides oleivorans TaxID=273676 RepID=A0A4Q2S157_9ACTN|nr:hypothetical protein [Nocardioides oleivorans]RYB95360.1 hypothetical protein EUA93_14045 [Nocardioides oleivorans]